MRGLRDADAAVYVSSGALAVLVFAAGMAALARGGPSGFDLGDAAWFVAGFGVCMTIYFVSMSLSRLAPDE